jgi:GNAT superfamily N-acetyltransferase
MLWDSPHSHSHINTSAWRAVNYVRVHQEYAQKVYGERLKIVDTAQHSISSVRFDQFTAPLAVSLAWEVESLLLEIFEYGDYSFRSALRGDYAETLCCSFVLVRRDAQLIGAAGCLRPRRNREVALLGPVGVRPAYRGRGIGTKLVRMLLNHLEMEGCQAVYLGITASHPAMRLYERLGFRSYHGIVMRRLSMEGSRFDVEHWRPGASVETRAVCWGDFPGVQALMSVPSSMYTYDLPRGLFSSQYVPPERFLGVFPEMMRALTQYGGAASVLLAQPADRVVGIAQVRKLPGAARQHFAELDFYLHDNFLEHARPFIQETIVRGKATSVHQTYGYCLSSDHLKQSILTQLGGRMIAVLKRNACVRGEFMDTIVYELE